MNELAEELAQQRFLIVRTRRVAGLTDRYTQDSLLCQQVTVLEVHFYELNFLLPTRWIYHAESSEYVSQK
jgi:hypothetical protein